MSLRSAVTLLALVSSIRTGTASAASPAPNPPNSVSGVASFADEHLKFTNGLAWWDADGGLVQMALFDRVPPAGILAKLRQGFSGEGGPVAHLVLGIKPGAPLSPKSVGSCYVQFTFPVAGPLGDNGDAKECGISEIGGDPRAGGTVAVRLKGQARGPKATSFTWDLSLNLPIAK